MCSLYLGENLISGNKPINLGVRNIGEIFPASLPITDAGAHLLDGSLILGGGIYQGFVDYIAELYTANPSANYFTTEALWQQSVTTYGVCGKFVYDSVNNTVRLPKITGIIEGTTDVSALGDLVEAGLPIHTHTRGDMNITGGFVESSDYAAHNTYGAFTWGNYGGGWTSGGTGGVRTRIYFDASRSWTGSTSNPNYTNSAIQNSNTVQPQTIKILYYIVIATNTKTEIEVDIDEVATDLNGKADVDLTNVSPSSSFATILNNVGIRTVVSTYSSGSTHYRIYSDGWCEQSWHASAPSTINTTIALPIPFKDTNYTVIGNPADYGDLYIVGITAYPYNNSRFYALCAYNGTGYANACTWYACGYVS